MIAALSARKSTEKGWVVLGGWKTERMMRRYAAAVTDQTLRAAAEAVSGAESHSKICDFPDKRGTPAGT